MFVVISYSFRIFVLTKLIYAKMLTYILQKPCGVLSLVFSPFLKRNEEISPLLFDDILLNSSCICVVSGILFESYWRSSFQRRNEKVETIDWIQNIGSKEHTQKELPTTWEAAGHYLRRNMWKTEWNSRPELRRQEKKAVPLQAMKAHGKVEV